MYIKHICTYNLLAWKWINQKFDVQWKYLLCFIFAHTAFYFEGQRVKTYLFIGHCNSVLKYCPYNTFKTIWSSQGPFVPIELVCVRWEDIL